MGYRCGKCCSKIQPSPTGRGCPACASHRAADELVASARVLTKLHDSLDAPDKELDEYLRAIETAAITLRRHATNHRDVAKMLGATRRP